jgi:hypothetical protein
MNEFREILLQNCETHRLFLVFPVGAGDGWQASAMARKAFLQP